MRKAIGAAVTAAMLWAFTPSEAGAQETSAPASTATSQKAPVPSPWSFSVSPYLWTAGMKGKVAVGSNLPAIDVDVAFKDIFKNIDWFPPPTMVVGEVRYDRFAAFSDFIFLGLEADHSVTKGPIAASAEADLDTIVWTFGGSYRFIDNKFGSAGLLLGGRLWNVDAKGKFAGPFAGRQASGNKTWVDAIVGLNTRINLGGGFALEGEADVGGGASKVDWQLLGTLQYQAEEWLTLQAGYRYLSVDFSDGNFLYDVALSGPIIGATLRF